MRKIKNLFMIMVITIIAIIVMPTKIYAAEVISNVNINFTNPTLKGTFEPITLDNLEITNSSSTSLKSAVTTFIASCTTTNANGVVGCSNYNNPGIYTFSIDIGLNTSVASFQVSGNSYTGSLTLNGNGISNGGSSANSLKVYLTFDLRENKDIEDLKLYYYPTVGNVVDPFDMISLADNISSMAFYSKYVEGTGWEELFNGNITFTAGTKYKISFAGVSSNSYILEAKNKTATATANEYDVVINFNDEQINAKYDSSNKTLSFEYEFEAAKDKFNVIYDANGHGNAPTSTTVNPGDKITKPNDLTDATYTFGGWYTDVNCTKAYNFDKKVFKDIKLYAKWIAPIENPKTSDGINSSIMLGIISLISLTSCGLYIKKKKFN